MHPDIVEASPGDCPICKMRLVPVRLEAVWTCPVHRHVAENESGTCPIDRRDLVQMTMAVSWTCASHPEIDQLERGTCADGTPMIPKRTLRPHGNHNPQHGGQFFMAPDNFHHLEGAYPRARLFRLYLYDDYARPLPADQLARVKARVVTSERFDAATRATTEIASFSLVYKSGRRYLEARIDTKTPVAQMSAKVRFKNDAPEYRFDFTFASFTKEPLPALPAPAPSAQTPAPAPPAVDLQPPVDPSLVPLPIPDTVDQMISQLSTRTGQVGDLIRRGDFTAVYVPAFQAKDLAIALESRLETLTSVQRAAAEPALQRLVRAAWLLDAFGDLGNRQQIADAYAIFTSASSDVAAAFK